MIENTHFILFFSNLVLHSSLMDFKIQIFKLISFIFHKIFILLTIVGWILSFYQPDITAPGLNILAAWTEASPPTQLLQDHRVVKYNIASGTSMSCPHVSAVAALLKAIHPDWSSAAIRSSLMTTGCTFLLLFSFYTCSV